ncbi:RAB11-binding protein RELCH homolog [Anthonomus grandis grandis]|uniref:RAB11-binding protein RELCH homolog n=1 Tax=Anthonomus grandis grandis TaxID=2921223 RepID=UPI002165DA43|nr:RAB11-binding protein RELCH homolog [Anthonomus grandis grandis]
MSLTAPDCDIPEPRQQSKISDKNLISYNEVAARLLDDKLYLTALELHSEFIEAGKELKILSNFFSNPGNFEGQTQEFNSRLSRSGSQATLDSLDLTRYSEDGAIGDERVAVLEFELRKAKDTINALRNNLTFATESETSTPTKGSLRNIAGTSIKPHEQRALNFLINEYLLLQGYKLTSITFADENQQQDFDDWDDVGLNISKPPELVYLYREGLKQSGQNGVAVATQTDFENEQENIIREQDCELEKLKSKVYFLEADLAELQALNESYLKDTPDQKVSDCSDSSPEKFQIVHETTFKKTYTEDNFSCNSPNWTKINIKDNNESFTKHVHKSCYLDINPATHYDIHHSLTNDIDVDKLIHNLTQSLLKLIPNIILNKREEAIPLLMMAVQLNTKASERDKLLQQLFHLKKRPNEEERAVILAAVIAIAKNAGEQMVENEVLPQCWLQLTHKHVERRLLVAEACTVLIPYVSGPIRNSLVLSMLQQMLEDKEEIVRQQIIKASALLFCYCCDPDKYPQCETIAFSSLKDYSNAVTHLSIQVLFPVLAKWALNDGLLCTSLLKKLLHQLNQLVKNIESHAKIGQEMDQLHRILSVIDNLLPYLLTNIAYHDNVISNIEKDVIIPIRSDFKNLCTGLTNPEIFMKSELNFGTVLSEFDRYVSDNPNISWPEMDWVVDVMLPDLLNNLHHIELAQQTLLEGFLNLFKHICIVFGHGFIKYKLRPILHKKIQNLEQLISSFNQFCPSLNVVPIYITLLTYMKDYDEISTVLRKFLCALPLCGSPLDCLDITVRKLCEEGLQGIVVDCLWSGVVHQRPLVKSASANLFCAIISNCGEELLKSKVVGAIVTLANDSDILVRTATIPALGRLITNCNVKEIQDKSYMQLQTLLNDSTLKDNHTLSRQLIVTLGNIFVSSNSSFRNDVILPQLTTYAMFMSQMSNHTRKIDMALALVEAFTHVVYSPLMSINNVVKPGLKHLESVIAENPSLSVHHETVLSMIKECDNKSSGSGPASPVGLNANQGVEDMRQRMSKIFNKPNVHTNLQGIFKKK